MCSENSIIAIFLALVLGAGVCVANYWVDEERTEVVTLLEKGHTGSWIQIVGKTIINHPEQWNLRIKFEDRTQDTVTVNVEFWNTVKAQDKLHATVSYGNIFGNRFVTDVYK